MEASSVKLFEFSLPPNKALKAEALPLTSLPLFKGKTEALEVYVTGVCMAKKERPAAPAIPATKIIKRNFFILLNIASVSSCVVMFSIWLWLINRR